MQKSLERLVVMNTRENNQHSPIHTAKDMTTCVDITRLTYNREGGGGVVWGQ